MRGWPEQASTSQDKPGHDSEKVTANGRDAP
jgi:hypothetical protein